MKKLLVTLILILTVFSAQSQARVIYNYVKISDNTGKEVISEATTLVFYNYRGGTSIKAYLASGDVVYYDRLSEVERGKTEDNLYYWYAIYHQRDSELEYIIQLFDDNSLGIRLVTRGGGLSIQIY